MKIHTYEKAFLGVGIVVVDGGSLLGGHNCRSVALGTQAGSKLTRAQELYPHGNLPWAKAHARHAARHSATPQPDAGQIIEPSVSEPIATGA